MHLKGYSIDFFFPSSLKCFQMSGFLSLQLQEEAPCKLGLQWRHGNLKMLCVILKTRLNIVSHSANIREQADGIKDLSCWIYALKQYVWKFKTSK